jgi:hypothetical protein
MIKLYIRRTLEMVPLLYSKFEPRTCSKKISVHPLPPAENWVQLLDARANGAKPKNKTVNEIRFHAELIFSFHATHGCDLPLLQPPDPC